jgi:sugar transferase (PEP-CTERM/EpsH1 system associated)
MNILWLSHVVPFPPKGGVLQRSFNLLREISKSNNIYLVAFNQKALLPDGHHIDEAISALKKYCCEIQVIPLPADKSKWSKNILIWKSFFTEKPYTVNWNYSADMMRAIVNVLKEFKPHVIHYDTIGMAEYFQYNLPGVLNHHNIESHMMLRRAQKEKNCLKKMYFYQEAKKIERYEKKVCKLFQSNLVVSDEDKSILKRIAPAAIIDIVPNGVDTSYFVPSAEMPDNETLIFAGAMNWYPNKDAMLFFADEIWPLLKAKRPTIKMIVVGQSPPARLLALNKHDPNFIVTGYVDDVRSYFKQASIYICPMRDGGGTRLKILDSLASGIPTVATSMAVEGIKITPGENVIIANKPEEFSNEILSLIDNPGKRKWLSTEGRHLVDTLYDWYNIGSHLNDVYKRLAY